MQAYSPLWSTSELRDLETPVSAKVNPCNPWERLPSSLPEILPKPHPIDPRLMPPGSPLFSGTQGWGARMKAITRGSPRPAGGRSTPPIDNDPVLGGLSPSESAKGVPGATIHSSSGSRTGMSSWMTWASLSPAVLVFSLQRRGLGRSWRFRHCPNALSSNPIYTHTRRG